MGLRNPAPSRTATPQQLAQHARRLAEAADREASRLARAAPSDMPHAQTFFRSQSLSPGDGSDYLSPPSSLPTVAPVAANAAQDVVPETQALTGGNAAAALIGAVAPGATGCWLRAPSSDVPHAAPAESCRKRAETHQTWRGTPPRHLVRRTLHARLAGEVIQRCALFTAHQPRLPAAVQRLSVSRCADIFLCVSTSAINQLRTASVVLLLPINELEDAAARWSW